MIVHISLALTVVFGCGDDDPKTTQTEPTGCDTIILFAGEEICLPIVEGWTEAFGNALLGEGRVGADDTLNRTLGIYISEKQMALGDELKHAVLEDYFKIYTPKNFDRFRVSPAQLTQVIEQFNGQAMRAEWKDAESFWEQKHSAFDLSVPVLMESYRLNEKVGTGLYLMRSEVVGQEQFTLMTISTIIIKDRLVFVGHYLDYNGAASVKSAKAKCDYFNLRFLDQNRS